MLPYFFQPDSPRIIYLDSAATAQKPQVVIDAMTAFLSKEYGTVHRSVYGLAAQATHKYNKVREQVKNLIGARFIEEIVFTRGTTESINLVATSFGKEFIHEGDEVLVVETEHHSNIVPWQMLCKEKKAILRVIPVNDQGDVSLNVLEKMLSHKVKLIAVAHIANATGAIHPIVPIIQLAHQWGAKVLVDAAQSISHLPIAVQEWGVDFLAFSGHKMYGPTGVGVLYGKKELLEKMPPYQGGGDMVKTVTFEKTLYQEPPLKFEAGTPSILEVIGLGAAISFLQTVGLEKIQKMEHDLTQYALQQLSCVPGLRWLCEPQNRASLLSFTIEGCHSLDVGTLLDIKGIAVRTGSLCAQPALQRFGVTSTIRVSFAIYNTKEDIDALVLALQQIVQTLR